METGREMYLALGEGLDVGSAAVGLLVLAGYALPQEQIGRAHV